MQRQVIHNQFCLGLIASAILADRMAQFKTPSLRYFKRIEFFKRPVILNARFGPDSGLARADSDMQSPRVTYPAKPIQDVVPCVLKEHGSPYIWPWEFDIWAARPGRGQASMWSVGMTPIADIHALEASDPKMWRQFLQASFFLHGYPIVRPCNPLLCPLKGTVIHIFRRLIHRPIPRP